MPEILLSCERSEHPVNQSENDGILPAKGRQASAAQNDNDFAFNC
ncbi:MAG: hypothetical protein V1770_02815 [bacterium]